MIYNKKPQEGVFIGVFALATLVAISLAIGFLSNRVNDLLSNQGQMIAGRQAYWLAFSGAEVIAQDKLADLGSPTKGDGSGGIGEVYAKHYSFVGGNIQVNGNNQSSGYHNGLARTEIVTIIGTDANSAHQIKWTLGSPDHRAYNFTFSEATTPTLTMASAVNIAEDAIFTISAWVHMDAIDGKPLFGVTDADDDWIRFTDANNMAIKGDGTEQSLSHGLTVGTGSWQHIVITRGALPDLNSVTVYVNGVVGSNPAVWNKEFFPSAIGTDFAGESRHYFDGRIAQVAIWGRTLDVPEIQSIYCQGYTFSLITDADGGVGEGLDEDLIHYWKLDRLTTPPPNGTDSKGSNHLTKQLPAKASIQATGI